MPEDAMDIKEDEGKDFVQLFEIFACHVHANAIRKGFYEKPPSDIERIALMMEELGDAIKAIRAKEMPKDEHCPQHTRLEIKLADTVIRIMDYSAYRDLNVADALLDKIEANKHRPYKHDKRI